MSFDLAVFRPLRALDDAAATALYIALCDAPTSPARRDAEAALAAEAKLEAFYAALTAIYPELDDDEDESPFACVIERRPCAVILNVSFSRADEVAHTVEKLALAHGLDTFDPQTSKLLRAAPGAEPRPAGTPKLKPKEGLDRFVAGIGPKLLALGFAPVPRVKHAWARTVESGITHQVSLNLGTRNVRPDVAIGHPTAAAWLAAALGKREPAPTMGLAYLYFQGWIPGRPWREGEGDFDYAICHAECVAAAIADFTRTIQDYAFPFFDALRTLPALADFYERTTSYADARPNWTMEREKLSGFGGRYWGTARGLLHGTALRTLAEPARTAAHFVEARARAALWKEKDASAFFKPELFAQLDALEAAVAAPVDAKPRKAAKAKKPKA